MGHRHPFPVIRLDAHCRDQTVVSHDNRGSEHCDARFWWELQFFVAYCLVVAEKRGSAASHRV
jgi:hypothetical protein